MKNSFYARAIITLNKQDTHKVHDCTTMEHRATSKKGR